MKPIPRSYLFVPGDRPDRFLKALASGAHAVIVDLEDAVGPSRKEEARKAVAHWLDTAHPVALRVNAAETEWFAEDAPLGRLPGVAAVMLPKTESVEQVRVLREHVGAGVPLLPMIESALGFAHSADIARAEGVQRLVFGSFDFQVDLAIDGDDDELLYFRSQLVLVSRLAGLLSPIDGVWTGIDDSEPLRAHTLRGRRLGFGGKLCIHPNQVPHVNACFQPTGDEVAWAKRVLEAVARSAGSAVALEGRMVDRPLLLKAEAILEEVKRSSAP